MTRRRIWLAVLWILFAYWLLSAIANWISGNSDRAIDAVQYALIFLLMIRLEDAEDRLSIHGGALLALARALGVKTGGDA